jgi:PelA/Pel-15E family pectate lyase
MPSAVRHVRHLPLISCLLILRTACAADAARQWAPDAFVPLSEARIAALPAAEQPAWRAYWQASVARSKRVGPRDLFDHSSTKPLDGPPIPSTYSKGVRLDAGAAWYASTEARTIADRVAGWQTATGGWVKTGDYTRDRKPRDDHHDAWSAGTFDNNSTVFELRFLALVLSATASDERARLRARVWRESFDRGLDYVFAAQYPNGGFPQIHPLVGWYHDAITYNDDAMVHILSFLRDVADRKPEFSFLPDTTSSDARHRLELGIRCVLAAQLKSPDGHRDIWGQQCDPLTLQPCAARNFEPAAATSNESAGLVEFFMSIPQPAPEIVAAVDGAMAWFSRTAMHGVVWDRSSTEGTGLLPRAGASDLWARFYELGTGKPIFGERDRTIHYAVTELLNERRHGYGWFSSRPATLVQRYGAWRQKAVASAK